MQVIRSTSRLSDVQSDNDSLPADNNKNKGSKGRDNIETGKELFDEKETPVLAVNTNKLSSLPQLNIAASREEILRYFENTWALTEMLFSSLRNEQAFLVSPYHKTRHPLIFYYAHPVCFYVNKLLVSGLIDEPVNSEFELLFETGVDEMKWDDLHEGKDHIWPALEEVVAYRHAVYNLVKKVIETHPCFNLPINMASKAWSVVMAFEHERIHLETSSVLIRELPAEHVQPPLQWPESISQQESTQWQPEAGADYPRDNPLLSVTRRSVRLGKPSEWPSFGWDNEYGSDERKVPAFSASKFLISNGEFYQFVASGGYETRHYWSEPGWEWRSFRNIKWPTFWVQDGPAGSHRYKLRSTFSVLDMQWNLPAIVNYYEAKAYCAWLTESKNADVPFRLLREAEHLAIRGPQSDNSNRINVATNDPGQLDPVMNSRGFDNANLNLTYGAESPVDAMPANAQGFHDAMGNVWQWSDDTFQPLPGFEIHPYYTDFSTPCFDDEHQMILGGSFISTGDEASIWARFHFRPHFFQHAGFRIVQSDSESSTDGNKYESSELVDQYLLFHYGSAAQQRDDAISARVGHPHSGEFVLHMAKLAARYTQGNESALDLGCAVGRASFELARTFDQVIGLDNSGSFIDTALKLKKDGRINYRRTETGNYYSELAAWVPVDIDRNKVQFHTGDACNLQENTNLELTAPFDTVLLANLLCRLPDPQACLRQFTGPDNRWLKGDGVLIIASPNTWSTLYTPTNKYLDGISSEETIACLARVLTGFELLHEEDYPFMIREHRRKYEYIVSQITVWKKTGKS